MKLAEFTLTSCLCPSRCTSTSRNDKRKQCSGGLIVTLYLFESRFSLRSTCFLQLVCRSLFGSLLYVDCRLQDRNPELTCVRIDNFLPYTMFVIINMKSKDLNLCVSHKDFFIFSFELPVFLPFCCG